MSDDSISRQAAIAHAISGRTRELDGEKWIRVSEVRESLQTMPSAQPEILRCKKCKYNPDNPRPFYDDDPVETYAWCKTEYFDEQGFCSCGKLAINLR